MNAAIPEIPLQRRAILRRLAWQAAARSTATATAHHGKSKRIAQRRNV